jgi:glyoxylase-like metal-dependent hydrolase (beta-lactamase superfamily II)
MARDTVIAERDWHRTAAAPTAMPDRTFQDSTSLTIGGMNFQVLHIPGAHTNGDAMVLVPGLDLMHVGDVVEPGAPPFIDWWAGGSLSGMIRAADMILARAGPATRIVPGHGPVIGRTEVAFHRKMLVTLRDGITAALGAGTTRDDFIATHPAREYQDFLGGARRVDGFLRLLWWGLADGRT